MLRLARFALLPLAVSGGCVELLVMGDYGTRDSRQASVAQGLAAVAGARQPAAVAAIGDNIYPDGAEDSPWTVARWWRDVYLGYDSLNRPWHVITGNHDWRTDGRVERDFTTSSENRGSHWQMPDFWYKKRYESDGLTVDAFYIDTQVWKGSRTVERSIGNQARQRQIDWLFSELEKSTADWKIVLGHHPVYSAGNHGMTEVLYRELDPKLREYGVPLYFAGHDHSKQVIYYEGLSYVISGAGGAWARPRSNQYPEGSLKHYFADPGFVGPQICDKRKATVTLYGAGGEVQATWPVENSVRRGQTRMALRLASQKEVFAAATCAEGIQLKDVEKWCSRDGCRVLADSPEKSCEAFCFGQSLRCVAAWTQHEDAEDCAMDSSLSCGASPAMNSSLICQCTASKPNIFP